MEHIATIKKTTQILKENNFFMKKNYGQNFMISPKIPELIASQDILDSKTTVIEVGPGVGALTEFLSKKVKKVICYEIDKELIPILNGLFNDVDNVTIIEGDFLKADVSSLVGDEDKVVIVSNLPYYLTSEIIIKCLTNQRHLDLIMMMQKEVAKRILNSSGGKDENELTLITKYYSVVSKVTEVSKNDFFPRPNVDSTVLMFKRKDVKEIGFVEGIKVLYSQRRKTVYNNLKEVIKDSNRIEEILKDLNIERTLRVEDLEWNKLLELIELVFGGDSL